MVVGMVHMGEYFWWEISTRLSYGVLYFHIRRVQQGSRGICVLATWLYSLVIQNNTEDLRKSSCTKNYKAPLSFLCPSLFYYIDIMSFHSTHRKVKC